MKVSYILLIALFASIKGFSQVPEMIKYQAVYRDVSGNIITGQVTVDISIYDAMVAGNMLWTETQLITSTSQGILNINIGETTAGVPDAFLFSGGATFIEITIDGNIMGRSQVLSVPYAYLAKRAELDEVDDADADPANEIQNITLTDDTLYLSNGGNVPLTSYVDTVYWTNSGNDVVNSNSGNIGINNSSPSEQVEINGGIAVDSILVKNIPGFSVTGIGTGTALMTGGWSKLTNWQTSSHSHLFNNGNYFNETTGDFVAPRNGYYQISANIRLDGMNNGSYTRVMGIINNNLSVTSGLEALTGNGTSTNFQIMHFNNFIKLNQGDIVSIFVYTPGLAPNFYGSESSFSMMLISDF